MHIDNYIGNGKGSKCEHYCLGRLWTRFFGTHVPILFCSVSEIFPFRKKPIADKNDRAQPLCERNAPYGVYWYVRYT